MENARCADPFAGEPMDWFMYEWVEGKNLTEARKTMDEIAQQRADDKVAELFAHINSIPGELRALLAAALPSLCLVKQPRLEIWDLPDGNILLAGNNHDPAAVEVPARVTCLLLLPQ